MNIVLLGAAPLLIVRSLLPVAAPGARPADAVWSGTLRGHARVLILRERSDGRLIGYLPSDPAIWVSGGRRDGRHVGIDLASDDGAHAWTGSFHGDLGGGGLAGVVAYSDLGGQAVHLRRTAIPVRVEHWILSDTSEGRALRLSRVLDGGSRFAAGGYVQTEGCGFLGCSGAISSWTVAGLVHTLSVVAATDCPNTADLTATWDPSELLIQDGHWTRSGMPCRVGASGDFFGGKEGLAPLADVGDTLSLLAGFLDAIEAESPDAVQAFAAAFRNDGATRADWQGVLAGLYSSFDALEASATEIRQVVTANDTDVNPMVLQPPRVEWHLTVTGVPAGGGARTLALDRVAGLAGEQGVYFIGREGEGMAFVGNGYDAPFAVDLPVAAGDQAFAAYGVWPYGVHGGGHPEGHPGLDFDFAPGASIRAAASGTVDRIEANGEFPDQWNVRVRHRAAYETKYDHVGALAVGVAAGAAVVPGQALGLAGDAGSGGSHFYMTHFAVSIGIDNACPVPYLSAAAASLFDTIWAGAAYNEELTEPFPCNPIDVAFPLTRAWTRTAGTLPARIDFIRLDPHTADYRYALRNAAGAVIESGAVSMLQPSSGSGGGLIDLQPDAGPTHLGRYRIISSQMLIAWGPTRPSNLAGAAAYTTPTP
jgi:murein DD-endopeptidase MepM/ murein hydrolase activator NlpD